MIEVEAILNLLPEVTWDRWAGHVFDNVSVYGWLPREDGKSDYVLLMLDENGCWFFSTSSAEHSATFAERLGFKTHKACKRVEDYFEGFGCVRLNEESTPPQQ